MQLGLRPYMTTGVAIVGASVIAVTPVIPTPTEIELPEVAAEISAPVQLAANEVEEVFNTLAFAGADLLVSLAKLPAPVVAALLGEDESEAELLLTLGAIGLFGPLISGTGATGAALQSIVDAIVSGDPANILLALIGAPAILIDGLVNGGPAFGPDLASLISAMFPPTFAGGLINPGFLPLIAPAALALPTFVVPGTIPTLQGLVERLFGLLSPPETMEAETLAALIEEEPARPIEDTVNELVLALVAFPIVTVSQLVGSLLAPILGEGVAALLPVAALSLLGPLISGPGAVGHALQDIANDLGSGDIAGLVSTLIGAPATVIDGIVNGGFGPDLLPLVFPDLPLPITLKAGGLINDLVLEPVFGAIDALISIPIGLNIILPGTFPTLQTLVGTLLGLTEFALPIPDMLEASSITSTNIDNQRSFVVDVPKQDEKVQAGGQAQDQEQGLDASVQNAKSTGGSQVQETDTGQQAVDAVEGSASAQGSGVQLTTAPDPQPAPTELNETTTTVNGGTDVGDGFKFVPEPNEPKSQGNGDRRVGPIGAVVRGVAKGIGDTVKGVLGGGKPKKAEANNTE